MNSIAMIPDSSPAPSATERPCPRYALLERLVRDERVNGWRLVYDARESRAAAGSSSETDTVNWRTGTPLRSADHAVPSS